MNLKLRHDGCGRQRGGTPGGSSYASRQSSLRAAFTLLEVIVACAIFFMVAFAILELVASSLKSVRKLQSREPDPGIILHKLGMSNIWEETVVEGTFEDIAPKMYPGYRYGAEAREVGSNGLWQVDVTVYNDKDHKKGATHISTMFYSPRSKPGSATKGHP
jgi:Tfp pilus assembly protein PilV